MGGLSFLCRAVCAAVLASLLPLAAAAEGLRVAPVLLEVVAPAAAGKLMLRNEGRAVMTVQARVYRWVQRNGTESLEPTRDVVVSPPMTRIAPGASQTLRVVRTAKGRIRGEEAYRVIVDEVPDRRMTRSGRVNFATELRLPVFFVGAGATAPQLRWSIRGSGAGAVLVARNTGDLHLRIADVTLGGAVRRPGLLGYVLGGSVMQWPIGSGRLGSGAMRLRAQTNFGTLDVPLGRE
ncbi:fimbrial chaperone protein [Rhodobacter sp. 140A]|uniref:Pili assembly chaperone N-terminal domain-containing protein n=1 Tax=bioreactor metagenome TaxID=1076179 RepID=A0A644UMM8_9ZZZZ|nr:fimbrial chaperone protein [Rhodobacter sp. 140A]